MWGLRSTEGKRRLGGVIALGQSLLPSQMASSIRNERYLILDADIVKTSVILLAKKLLPPGGIPSPGGKIEPAEVVHLGYVLNVIEEPSERSDTLRRPLIVYGGSDRCRSDRSNGGGPHRIQ